MSEPAKSPPEQPSVLHAVIPEEARKQMELAMLCGRLNCELAGSDIWSRIPAEGDCPTPQELIVWAAAEVIRRMKSRD